MAQGTYALNSNKGTRERIGRLLLMHANSREDIDVARTGDIVAVAGLKNVITGETLCDDKKPIILERMEVRKPTARSLNARPGTRRSPRGKFEVQGLCVTLAQGLNALSSCAI